MRKNLYVSFCLLALSAGSAEAGAWLREKGKTFSSTAFTITADQDIANTSYLEYGLRPDLTLGADLRIAHDRLGVQDGFATLFMRRPLGDPDKTSKWAYELGLGATWDDSVVQPHVKIGLSWGRGLQWGERYGWMSVDSSYRWDITTSQGTLKVDSTIGMGFTEVTTGMLQLYLTDFDGTASASIAPSLVLQPRGREYRIQIGAETPLDDTGSTALKLGLWRTF